MSAADTSEHKAAVAHARAAMDKGEDRFFAVRDAMKHAYGDAGSQMLWSAMGGDPGKEILALYKALGYEVTQ